MMVKKIFETVKDTNSRIQEISAKERIQPDKQHLACSVRVNQQRTFQSFEGFGGALTESSGYVLSLIPDEKRKEVLEAYYSPDKGIG